MIHWQHLLLISLIFVECPNVKSIPLLVGVSKNSSFGLVIAVAEFIPNLADIACSQTEISNNDVIQKRLGDWVFNNAVHRGVSRDFWYNELTHQSRWADKFTPPRNSKQTQPINKQTTIPKLIDSVLPLTYDRATPICASNHSGAFVLKEHAPALFCAHFLGITQPIMRKRMINNAKKSLRFDQFILEHTLLLKWLQIKANHRCNHGDKIFDKNTLNTKSSMKNDNLFCDEQFQKADVIVVPSLVFHCTPSSDRGFQNKVLKEVLTYDAYVHYWTKVNELFHEPFIREKPFNQRTQHDEAPLIVIHHRFVWDVPQFRMMISTLIQTQPPSLVSRVIIPGLESSLLEPEKKLFPPQWTGFITNQLLLRHLNKHQLLQSSEVTPLLITMPYPLPILTPHNWSTLTSSSLSSPMISSKSEIEKPLSVSSVQRNKNMNNNINDENDQQRPISILLYGDGMKPSPGRWYARNNIGNYDDRCKDEETMVCWICSDSKKNDYDKSKHFKLNSKKEQENMKYYHEILQLSKKYSNIKYDKKLSIPWFDELKQFEITSSSSSYGDSVYLKNELTSSYPGSSSMTSVSFNESSLNGYNKNEIKEATNILQELKSKVGRYIGLLKKTNEKNHLVNNHDDIARVVFQHEVWQVPLSWLVSDKIGHCGDLMRHDHFWQLTVNSVFCIEPAGDSPTRSHFYLSVLSGCIPVLLDGDAPRFHNNSMTPWAFRKNNNENEKRNENYSSSSNFSMFFPHIQHIDKMKKRFHFEELDYSTFCIILSSKLIEENKLDIIQHLQSISWEEVKRLRKGLDKVAPLFRYSPFRTYSNDNVLEHKINNELFPEHDYFSYDADVNGEDAFDMMYKVIELAHTL